MIKEYRVIKEDFQSAGIVSSNIKRLLKDLGIGGETLRKLAVASYEAEINMIIHSNGGVITLLLDEDNITLIFKDEGPGIENIELALKPGYSTASEKARELGFGAGMGLANIKRVSDEFDIVSSKGEKTTLTIKFRVNQ